ncbi:hypothetical protein BCR41DRAFT_373925 [Lobosporangium transversale]|uniref:Uncharacterized protein n=1 Tax=Lobosporangium transversale TaxID=64571 RepID=A0A1Y2GC91_9FUNG|nr:hypothetical protein BCR41DRAFT_373925 [Lobosporangium transversale]ORZ06813.1 hypothetical protein BCR41DRAFT_373925 [Lobosporangium transversale]|eukprot:XP_021877734.1 hypothetical protein BCR41DRAFT_373925 [Lobosporangium transversale]
MLNHFGRILSDLSTHTLWYLALAVIWAPKNRLDVTRSASGIQKRGYSIITNTFMFIAFTLLLWFDKSRAIYATSIWKTPYLTRLLDPQTRRTAYVAPFLGAGKCCTKEQQIMI